MSRVAFGTDRLSETEDGTIHLRCRFEKEGWIARRPADLVRQAFPGTCVRWGEEYFEVVEIEPLPVGVRYVLEPWSESYTMRTIQDYDEAAELDRTRRREESIRRQRQANRFTLSAIFSGLLPAEAQLERQQRIGVSPVLATLISASFWGALGGLCLVAIVSMILEGGRNPVPSIPRSVYLVGLVVLIESGIRFLWAFAAGRPVGSFPVVLVWTLVQLVTGRKSLREEEPKLRWELDAATKRRDEFVQWEPFLALLSPEEQREMARRYGFDWLRHGRSSAIVLLVFAIFVLAVTIAGIVRDSMRFGNAVTILLMVGLAAEQISRLGRFAAGEPAGSVLGPLVRPFTRKLIR